MRVASAAVPFALLLSACGGGDGGGGIDPPDAGPVPTPTPAILRLTVNRFPAELTGGGEGEAGFTWRVNRANFTLDVERIAGDGPFSLRCDVPFTLPGGSEVQADEAVSSAQLSADGTWETLAFTAQSPFPAGEANCSAQAEGGAATRLRFEAADLPPELDPFPREDVWVLDYSRDITAYSTELNDESGSIEVDESYMPDGNGTPDFEEEIALLGLIDPDGAPEAADAMLAHLRTRIAQSVQNCFDPGDGPAVPIRVVNAGDPEAPTTPFRFGRVADGAHSVIAIGSSFAPHDRTFGRHGFDLNNAFAQNSVFTHGSGAFIGEMVASTLRFPNFVMQFGEILPGIGLPFGHVASDLQLLAPDFDIDAVRDDAVRERLRTIQLAVNAGTLFSAIVTCHEIGHSVGLVPNGPPPFGLFGAEIELSFTLANTNSSHVDFGGNIMASLALITQAIAWLADTPRFAPTTMAYLRRQLVVGRRDWPGPVTFAAFEGGAASGARLCAHEAGSECQAVDAEGRLELDLGVNETRVFRVEGERVAPALVPISAFRPGLAFTPAAVLPDPPLLDLWLETADNASLDDTAAVVVSFITSGISDPPKLKPTRSEVTFGSVGGGALYYLSDAEDESVLTSAADWTPQQESIGFFVAGVPAGGVDFVLRPADNIECSPTSGWGVRGNGYVYVPTEAGQLSVAALRCLPGL